MRFAIKRVFDLFIALHAVLILAIPMILIAVLVKLDSPGPVMHWSRRFGSGGKLFYMPKFRTMELGTPQLPTHLLPDGASHTTRVGKFLRRFSLDELPQLLSVIKGDMSIVGPRPALFNQHDLMELRTARGVHLVTPGITGWAQVNGRDLICIEEKAQLDEYYALNQSLLFDIYIIFRTLYKNGSDVSH